MKLKEDVVSLASCSNRQITRISNQLVESLVAGNPPESVFGKWASHFTSGKGVELRLVDPIFVRRRLRNLIRAQVLFREQQERMIGGRSGTKYSGDWSLALRRRQLDQHSKLLNGRGVKIGGKILPLAEVGVTREKRFAELYVMIKGMESIASHAEFDWLFATFTAPSEFHPNPRNGKSSWNYSSAKDAHEYIKRCWAAWGRDMARQNLRLSAGRVFGVRVVEPHADGCPHWHVLFFLAPGAKETVIRLLEKHFMHSEKALDLKHGRRQSASETKQDAQEACASAASYVCKYLMKTTGSLPSTLLTGSAEVDESTGEPCLSEKSEHVSSNLENVRDQLSRVDAWRGATGIRAFQQFGGLVGVTKWRALRKYQNLVKRGGGYKVVHVDSSAAGSISALLVKRAAVAAGENDYPSFNRYVLNAEIILDSILIRDRSELNKYGEPIVKVVGIDFGAYEVYFHPVDVLPVPTHGWFQ